jgi:hypothetical protein
MPGPLQLGRIVWADIADANGVRKLRPAVIVTPSDRITSVAPLEVIAVTSRVPEPLPNDHVLLPWHAQGHPRTGLNRRCAAVCTWVARINHDDIRDVAGVIQGHSCWRSYPRFQRYCLLHPILRLRQASNPASNQLVERTAHPAGFFWLLRHRHGWAAAHRQRQTTKTVWKKSNQWGNIHLK